MLDLFETAPAVPASVSQSAVAALCVAPNSGYKAMPGVECFDKARDVRRFVGGMPVVAHPPCRAWSAYTAHQAKPEPGATVLRCDSA